MRTAYIYKQQYQHILAALTPENRLALEISLATGLRISDVLNLRTKDIKPKVTIRELKTGKKRQVSFSLELRERMASFAGKVFVFENRLDPLRPRTRQAVFKDIKRACKLFRIPNNLIVRCHTARKIYAVGAYKRTCSLKRVQELLCHSSEAVTMVYAMSEELTKRHFPDYV